MTTFESLLEPLRHSPRLYEAVDLLRQQIDNEERRRQQFYDEMTPEQKVEFINGQIIEHGPQRNCELDAIGSAFVLLSTHVAVRKLGTVHSQKCLCVFPRNDYSPDVVYFGPDKTAQFTPDTVKFPVPDLSVEVLSSSTERRDRGIKLEDFAAHGVGEYWIIDADEPFIEQYILKDGDYELRLKSSTGQLKSDVVSGFETDIEALFDEDANLQALRNLMAATE